MGAYDKRQHLLKLLLKNPNVKKNAAIKFSHLPDQVRFGHSEKQAKQTYNRLSKRLGKTKPGWHVFDDLTISVPKKPTFPLPGTDNTDLTGVYDPGLARRNKQKALRKRIK